ncbi:hypothetical protein [Yinghuangia seranimata]|uniref:hypothetical protein n=1 Tax=Yinghuangia seranimata TaxID=408067 RepID=UPI00248B6615|nr:hypothetical protein [Yinghuangia seranimata]MDI2132965.1 hypothetical protein [Yinghuangia seranimata]
MSGNGIGNGQGNGFGTGDGFADGEGFEDGFDDGGGFRWGDGGKRARGRGRGLGRGRRHEAGNMHESRSDPRLDGRLESGDGGHGGSHGGWDWVDLAPAADPERDSADGVLLAALLTEEAERGRFGDAPVAAILDASTVRARRNRGIVLAAAASVVVATLVAGGLAATGGGADHRPATPPYSGPASLPGPITTGGFPAKPADPPAVVEAAMRWQTRGSLRSDEAFLDGARNRLLENSYLTREAAEVNGTPVPLTANVWFAGDTPAGRIVIGLVAAPQGYGDGRYEVVVLGGRSGALAGALDPIGAAGSRVSVNATVSRLVETDGHWWAVALAPPGKADSARVSWRPEYSAQGRAPRVWQEVPVEDGFLAAAAPLSERPGTARLIVTGKDGLLSDERVDDQWYVLGGIDTSSDDAVFARMSTPAGIAALLAPSVGVPAEQLRVEVVATDHFSERDAGAHVTHAALAVIHLPNEAVLLFCGMFGTANNEMAELRTLTGAPPAAQAADAKNRAWVWHDAGETVLVAPGQAGRELRVVQDGQTYNWGTFSAGGFAVAAMAGTTVPAGSRVETRQPDGTWQPMAVVTGQAMDDPFDLTP